MIAILMSVYKNDQVSQLARSIISITTQQTLKPDYLCIVVDGQVNKELSFYLENLEIKDINLSVIWLERNVGLSNALNEGIKFLKKIGGIKYLVRMDADDISSPDRLRLQVDYMNNNGEIAVSSAQVYIFDDNIENLIGKRVLPSNRLTEFSKRKTPINHSCSIFLFRVFDDISYPNTRLPFEDWWISLRILKEGWKIGVLDEYLMFFRGGQEMLARRAGLNYLIKEVTFFFKIYDEGLMSLHTTMTNIFIRSIVRVLPKKIFFYLYKKRFHR